jgi:hypothetical protein
MRYRGENLVENSVNEECRGWNSEDIAGDSMIPETRGQQKVARLLFAPEKAA